MEDGDYWNKMELGQPNGKDTARENADVKKNANNPAHGTESDRRFEAYKRAHEIRKFETELFWKRGAYYWAFILAAFTGHFALVGLLFKKRDCFSFHGLQSLSALALFALVATSFFCFFFCFTWTLMNKGSKYWQKNWEAHITMLQAEFSGRLYTTILNTDDKNNFSCCPLSLKAYDYSVSKITMMTSNVLTVASAALCVFYSAVLFMKALRIEVDCPWSYIILVIVGLVVIIGIPALLCFKTKGNRNEDESQFFCKWRRIDKA